MEPKILRRTILTLAVAVPALEVGKLLASTSVSEITFYRNAQNYLPGTSTGCCFNWPGQALTASTSMFYASDLSGVTIDYARWVCAWNPNTGGSPTGVRLVHADLGPSNISQIARFDGTYASSVRVDTADVTSDLQDLITYGDDKLLGHQTYGNGSWGCRIYSSFIEVVWA